MRPVPQCPLTRPLYWKRDRNGSPSKLGPRQSLHEKWDEMAGDAWVRHCELCNQNVYNLSALTKAEAERLLSRNEGRICTKFYRRPDGTILTQQCPSSIRRLWGTALKWAAAAGFAIPAFAHDSIWCKPSSAKFESTGHKGKKARLSGTIYVNIHSNAGDERLPLASADVELVNLKSKDAQKLKVSEGGRFSIDVLPGRYRLYVQVEGFKSYSKESLHLRSETAVHADISMAIGSVGGAA